MLGVEKVWPAWSGTLGLERGISLGHGTGIVPEKSVAVFKILCKEASTLLLPGYKVS